MRSLNIERKVFVGSAQVSYIKFYKFYCIEVPTTYTGQILELDFLFVLLFLCFSIWPVNIPPPLFTGWGESNTAVLFHWNCRKMVSAALSLIPCQLEAGSCQIPTFPAASGAGLDLAEVWCRGWERQPTRMALQMPSAVLESCTRTVHSTWKYSD